MRTTDTELLRRYLSDRSEAAFSELVERYIALVYSAALRQVEGDTQAAEDVTQGVFTDLARKAGRLLQHPALTGWLYTSTRYLAANDRRSTARRRAHEQSAQFMNQVLRSEGPERDWSALRPVLDEAMHKLRPAEREAVLWRYFENHPFAEIGTRLGISENAARMRVERALDKLRTALGRRGVTSSASALAALIAAQAVAEIPAGLTSRVCHASVNDAAMGGLAGWLAAFLSSTTAKVGLAGLTATVVLALVMLHSHPSVKPSPARAGDGMADRALKSSPALTSGVAQADAESTTRSFDTRSAPERPKLQIRLLAADSGEPLPGAGVRYQWDLGSESSHQELVSDPGGFIEVGISNQATKIEFRAHVDGFAPTLLVWRPERGEALPSQYLWRLTPAVTLGGYVVNGDGVPVPGAAVHGFCRVDSPWEWQRETHVSSFKAQTGTNGQWRVQTAPELVRSFRITALHPDYAESAAAEVGEDPEIERQLRAGIYTFHLGAAGALRGRVVDASNYPIGGAEVLLGKLYYSESKQTKTAGDGTFEFVGVRYGEQLLTGNADGFASTTIRVVVRPESAPVELILSRGKALKVRVVDPLGQPIAQADVWLSTAAIKAAENELIPELRLASKTDAEGGVTFEHVPTSRIQAGVSAKGYMQICGRDISPAEFEVLLMVGPELTVAGTVRDLSSGKPVPRFKIVTGRPEPNGPYWSTMGRFQLAFEGGTFSNIYNEAVVCEPTNSGYLLKFEAEGYAPFISRFIAADERRATFDVELQPASTRQLTFLNPDGSPASWADVAFPELATNNALSLVPGGFEQQVRSDSALEKCDQQGRVKVPDPKLRRLIAANGKGYVEVDLKAQKGDIVQLQSWGRVEGTLLPKGREVAFSYGEHWTTEGIFINPFSTFHLKPDSTGRFMFPLVPPGRHQIVELIPGPGPEPRSYQYGRAVQVDIRTGETCRCAFDNTDQKN